MRAAAETLLASELSPAARTIVEDLRAFLTRFERYAFDTVPERELVALQSAALSVLSEVLTSPEIVL